MLSLSVSAAEEGDEAVDQEISLVNSEEEIIEDGSETETQTVGAFKISAGSGVDAYVDYSAGTVVLKRDSYLVGTGTMSKDWVQNIDMSRITSVKVDENSYSIGFPETASSMFRGCTSLTDVDLHKLHISGVEKLDYLFEGCTNLKNVDINFSATYSLLNNMDHMFSGCSSLTHLDFAGIDTSKVKDMDSLFSGCSSLESVNMSSCDMSSIVYTMNMFKGCNNLKVLKTPANSSKTIDLPHAMATKNGSSYTTVPAKRASMVLALSDNWNYGFPVGDGVTALDSYGIVLVSYGGKFWPNWLDYYGEDRETVTSIYLHTYYSGAEVYLPENSSAFFKGCKNLNQLDLTGFKTTGVTDISEMFSGCQSLTYLDLRGFDTSKTTDMSNLFYNCYKLEGINLRKFNTSRVKDMDYMFYNCHSLKELNLGSFDTSKTENMAYMFLNCYGLSELDLRSFNTANVRSMDNMFAGCISLKKLDVSSFNTSKVTVIDFMFSGVCSINELDLSSFDLSGVSKLYEYDARRGTFSMKDLLTLKTPRNCKANAEFSYWPMYDKNGTEYTSIPNKSYSIELFNSKILASGGFKDVRDKNAWYYVPVYWAVGRGYTSGMGEGTFQPNANLTRAQAVAFLYKLYGSPDVSYLPEVNFSDVPKSAWYYTAVRWAVGHGITSGYGSGTFQPNKNCTRAMIVTFLMNYSKVSVQYKKPTKSSNFKDVPEDAWYIDAVDWAVENGITSGYGEGTFRPNAICTRAMMVAFIKSLSELPLQN